MEIEVKFKADIGKLIELSSSGVLKLEETKTLLNQFKKEDLINYLLGEDTGFTEPQEPVPNVIKQVSKKEEDKSLKESEKEEIKEIDSPDEFDIDKIDFG